MLDGDSVIKYLGKCTSEAELSECRQTLLGFFDVNPHLNVNDYNSDPPAFLVYFVPVTQVHS